MTLLTTQTHGGSGYGPAKKLPVSDINHTTGTSLQFGEGRGDAEIKGMLSCLHTKA